MRFAPRLTLAALALSMADEPDDAEVEAPRQLFPITCVNCSTALQAKLGEGISRVQCSVCNTEFGVSVERKLQSIPAASNGDRRNEAEGIPPGWTEEQRKSSTGASSYRVYRGPNGERTQSRLAAWRVFHGGTAHAGITKKYGPPLAAGAAGLDGLIAAARDVYDG